MYTYKQTKQLKELLTNGTNKSDFKSLAMALARKKADTTVRSLSGPPLLHVLVLTNKNGANNNEIIDLVELNRAVLSSKDKDKRTALQSLIDALYSNECSLDDFKESAMILARQGANITLRSLSDPPLLHVLVLTNKNGANNNEIIELVELNDNVLKSTDKYNRTALQSLIDALHSNKCSFDDFKQSAMILARKGADLSLQGTVAPRNTLLHVLVLNQMEENSHEINELITLNSDVVNYKDGNGCTPLHSLVNNNSNIMADVLKRLLSETNLDLTDRQHATLLHAACRSGNLAAVKYFWDQALSLSALTRKNETLIHYAVLSGNTTLIQYLIDTKEIDINAKNQSGETALHLAAKQNNRVVIEQLVRNRADLAIKNKYGKRASEIAADQGLIKYLFLFQQIQAMHDYGILLKDRGISKGQTAIDLANSLTTKAHEFFEQPPEPRDFAEFEPAFLKLLHSKDQEMSAYRVAWKTIAVNIAIALTGIGLLLIIGQLIYSKAKENRALFLFQKSKTTREEKVADIELSSTMLKNYVQPSS